MTRNLVAVCVLYGGLGLTAIPASAQTRTVTGSPATADTIAQLFAGIAEATTALDLDRLLAYYEESDALTYVAQGRVIRSHATFSDVLNAQLRGLSGADLRWLDTYVDVLSSDAAVATATYEFTATLPTGDSVRTTGTYMCIYVRRDGGWQVRYSAHSFPQRRP
jgi:ketosteroid isomerase-like protein